MRKKELVELVENQQKQIKELSRNLLVLNHIVRYGKDGITIKSVFIDYMRFPQNFGLRVEYITKNYDPGIGEYEEVSSVTIDKSAAIDLRYTPGYKIDWKVICNKDDIIIFSLTTNVHNGDCVIIEKFIIDKNKNVVCPYTEVKEK